MIEVDTRRSLRRQRLTWSLLSLLSVTAAAWTLVSWTEAPLISVVAHLLCALMWFAAALDAHQELDRLTLRDKD